MKRFLSGLRHNAIAITALIVALSGHQIANAASTYYGNLVGGTISGSSANITGAVAGGAFTAASGSSSTFWTAAFGGAVSAGAGPTASAVGDLTGVRVAGTVVQSGAHGATIAYVPPVYALNGTSLGQTSHIVRGSVTAAGTGTTLTFSSSAAFADQTYSVSLFDATSGAIVTGSPIVVGTNTITFPSVSGHTYNFAFIGQ